MIIDNFDPFCIPTTPFKGNPPSIIDPDAPLPLSVALQGLKAVGPWQPQILNPDGGIYGIEFHERTLLYVPWEFLREHSLKYLLRLFAAEGPNHKAIITNLFIMVKLKAEDRTCVLPPEPVGQIKPAISNGK